MKKRFSVLQVILLCALTALVCSAFFVVVLGGPARLGETLKYTQMLSIIDDYYIGDADGLPVADAGYGAMISALDDRWSYYMTAADYGRYKELSDNKYTGIGVSITPDEDTGGLLITAVTEGSPAERAGIQPGFIMTAIDGTDITGMTTAEVRELIQACGEDAFTVTALISAGESADFTVACELIVTVPVSYEMLDPDTGYIRIANFESGCAEGFKAAVNELIDGGATRIVADVRNNPGGKVTELIAALDFLLPEGDIFVSASKNGKETVHTSDADCIDVPISVLVNESSYSAAEYFAAALSEYGRAVTVGERTTGKGRSQVTLELRDGSAVHISSKTYLTPDRVDLSETGGVTPDIEIGLDEEDASLLKQGRLDREDDAQLTAAIEAVSNIIGK